MQKGNRFIALTLGLGSARLGRNRRPLALWERLLGARCPHARQPERLPLPRTRRALALWERLLGARCHVDRNASLVLDAPSLYGNKSHALAASRTSA